MSHSALLGQHTNTFDPALLVNSSLSQCYPLNLATNIEFAKSAGEFNCR